MDPHNSPTADSSPKVIILDNLHQAGKLEEIFEGIHFPSNSTDQNQTWKASQYIIGTMNSTSLNAATAAASPTTTVNGFQMKSHNFRWLVCSPYTEPARGVLGRCLRQRLIFIETRTRSHDGEMGLVVDFLVRVHAYLNRVISEFHNNESNVSAIPPSVFLSCPINAGNNAGESSLASTEIPQKWFVQLWNETLCPLLIDIISEGVSLYPPSKNNGNQEWQDPSRFVIEHWPWHHHNQNLPLQHPRNQLVSIKAEDVGLKFEENDEKSSFYSSTSNLSSASRPTSVSNGSEDSNSTTATNESAVSSAPTDPLFNMLLHLQEAANKEAI